MTQNIDQEKILTKYNKILKEAENEELEEVQLDSLESNDSDEQIISNAQKAKDKLEKAIPTFKTIDLPPDKEIAYKQKFVPQCKMCKHHLRDEAEKMYVQSNFVVNRVKMWLEEQNEHFTWECIATHMKNHCLWDKPLVNMIERLESRQDELSTIKQDRIQWNLDALTSANLDLLAQIDSLSSDDSLKTYRAVCEGIKVQAQLMKLQHDTIGAQAQAQAMVDANNRRLVTFLEKLLQILEPEQRSEVLDLIREFQAQEANVNG